MSFTWPGASKKQLTDVNIRVSLGSRVAVLGANGAGKRCVWAGAGAQRGSGAHTSLTPTHTTTTNHHLPHLPTPTPNPAPGPRLLAARSSRC